MSGYDFSSKIRTPKNIKQMGKTEDSTKVYMEDYVRVFLEQEAGSNYNEESYAILIGEVRESEVSREIYVHGAVQIPQPRGKSMFPISEQTWSDIYRTMHQYFQSREIVGLFAGGLTMPDDMMPSLKQIHNELFSGSFKLLYTYAWIEKEDKCYISEKGKLRQLEGYYVYYDKNDEMQRYMLACSVSKAEKKNEMLYSESEEPIRDFTKKTVKHITKTNTPDMPKGKMVFRLGYMACTLLIISAFIAGNLLLNKRQREVVPSEAESFAELVNGNSKTNVFLDESLIDIEGDDKDKNSHTADNDSLGKGDKKGNSTEGKEIENNSDNRDEDDDGSNKGSNGNSKDKSGSNNSNDKDSDGSSKGNSDSNEDSGFSDKDKNNKGNKTSSDNKNDDKSSESKGDGSSIDSNKKDNNGDIKDKNNSTDDSNTDDYDSDDNNEDIEPTRTEETSAVVYQEYTVISGDTLASICRKLYGNMNYVKKICEINGLEDEDRIEIGQRLLVPEK